MFLSHLFFSSCYLRKKDKDLLTIKKADTDLNNWFKGKDVICVCVLLSYVQCFDYFAGNFAETNRARSEALAGARPSARGLWWCEARRCAGPRVELRGFSSKSRVGVGRAKCPRCYFVCERSGLGFGVAGRRRRGSMVVVGESPSDATTTPSTPAPTVIRSGPEVATPPLAATTAYM